MVWAAKFYICGLGIGGLVEGKLLMDLRGRWSVSDMFGNLPSPEVRARAAHLGVTGRTTYQLDSPVGLDLQVELAKLPLKEPLKIPLGWSSSESISGSPGPAL